MNTQEIWNYEKTVADRGFGTGKGMSMTREEKINAIICDEWQGWSESDLFEYFRHNRAWDYADQSDSDIDDQYDSICGE